MANKTQAKSNNQKSPPVGKGAFIRKQLKAGKTVPEIVAEGERAGLDIKASFIYNIRSGDKKTGGAPATGKKTAGAGKKTPAAGKKTAKAVANHHSRKATARPRLPAARDTARSSASTGGTPNLVSQVRSIVLRVGLDNAERVFGQVLTELKGELDATAS